MRVVPFSHEIRFFPDTLDEALIARGVLACSWQLTPHLLDQGETLGSVVGQGFVHEGDIGQAEACQYQGVAYIESAPPPIRSAQRA